MVCHAISGMLQEDTHSTLSGCMSMLRAQSMSAPSAARMVTISGVALSAMPLSPAAHCLRRSIVHLNAASHVCCCCCSPVLAHSAAHHRAVNGGSNSSSSSSRAGRPGSQLGSSSHRNRSPMLALGRPHSSARAPGKSYARKSASGGDQDGSEEGAPLLAAGSVGGSLHDGKAAAAQLAGSGVVTPAEPTDSEDAHVQQGTNLHMASLATGRMLCTVNFWLLFVQFTVGSGVCLAYLNNLGQLVVSLKGDHNGQVVFVSLFSVANAAGEHCLAAQQFAVAGVVDTMQSCTASQHWLPKCPLPHASVSVCLAISCRCNLCVCRTVNVNISFTSLCCFPSSRPPDHGLHT